MRSRRRQVHRSRRCGSIRRRTRQNTTCGYDCALGEGISRDPIGEVGGLNLYGFVGNEALQHVDRDGRIFWWLTGCSARKCRCKKVEVLPSNQMVVKGGRYPVIENVGMSVPIKIVVEGDPTLCKCSHRDKGSVTAGYPTQGPPKVFDPNKENPWQCDDKHEDVPGAENVQPTPPGVPWSGQTDTWHLVYDLTITVTCVDSDGVPMTSSGTASGSYWFTLVYNANGTVTGPTTISPPSGQN